MRRAFRSRTALAWPVQRRRRVSAHDKLFRRLLKEDGAAEALMREQLPPAISRRMTGAPVLLSESFIEASMKGLFADAVLKVPLKGAESAFVYCIVEHKRVEDRQVLLQLLRYLTAVYSHLAATHKARLPLVLPLIIYNGSDDWLGPLNFAALIDHRRALRRHALDFEVLFLDVARTPIASLSFHPKLKAGLLALRATAISPEKFEAGLSDLLVQLSAAFDESTRQLFINYLLLTADKERRPLIECAVEAQEKPLMMTVAESYERDGYRKGKREGEANGLRKTTRALLSKRFGKIPAEYSTKLKLASAKRLEKWFTLALTAKTIDAVFAK